MKKIFIPFVLIIFVIFIGSLIRGKENAVPVCSSRQTITSDYSMERNVTGLSDIFLNGENVEVRVYQTIKAGFNVNIDVRESHSGYFEKAFIESHNSGRKVVLDTKGSSLFINCPESDKKNKYQFQNHYKIDLYLPQGKFNIKLTAGEMDFSAYNDLNSNLIINCVKGVININNLKGALDIRLKTGLVDISEGLLKDNSRIEIAQRGNIKSGAAFKDDKSEYIFRTSNGNIFIKSDNLRIFDVKASAISINGNKEIFTENPAEGSKSTKVNLTASEGIINLY